jgi:ribosomal protein S18 acetylase RimI-like enzyme
MTDIIKKLKAIPLIYRNYGVGEVCRRVSAHLYEHTEFVVLQQCKYTFELRRIGEDAFEQFKSMPPPFPRHYAYRAEYGQRRCYGAFVGNRIAALMWPVFQADNTRVVSRWRDLLPDEARISSIWADPEYRGTGLMAACLERLVDYLKGFGFRYLYAFTWVGNVSSIKLHEKLGFQVVGNVHRYSLRWQREGRGMYRRAPIHRVPLAKSHPGGDLELPEIIPPRSEENGQFFLER